MGQDRHGVFTDRPGALSNDFFRNLLDMSTEWKPLSPEREAFEGRDRKTGQPKWTGSRIDLLFGSHSQLRALAEVYASEDAQQKFVRDFVRLGQGDEPGPLRPGLRPEAEPGPGGGRIPRLTPGIRRVSQQARDGAAAGPDRPVCSAWASHVRPLRPGAAGRCRR